MKRNARRFAQEWQDYADGLPPPKPIATSPRKIARITTDSFRHARNQLAHRRAAERLPVN
jgi:hypothetical protein